MNTHNLSQSQNDYSSERSPTKESTYYMIHFIKLANANYFIMTKIRSVVTMDGWRDGGGRNYKGASRNFWGGDGFIYYLDCGDGFKDIYMSKFIKFYTLSMCNLCVNYISIKQFLKI